MGFFARSHRKIHRNGCAHEKEPALLAQGDFQRNVFRGCLGEKRLVAIGVLPPTGRRPVNRVLDKGQLAQLGPLALLAGRRLAVLNVLHDGAAGGQSANRRDQKKSKSSWNGS